MTSNAENFARTVSTAFPMPDISILSAVVLISSKPFAAPSSRKARFNLSRVDKLVETFLSNLLLSNSIDTTRSSTVLLIV